MSQENCFICKSPLPPGVRKCPRCGAKFTPWEEMEGFKKELFIEARKPIQIPLEFWKNDNIVFTADFEVYLPKPQQKPKDFQKFLAKLIKTYKVQKTKQFDQQEYWYLVKFFFMRSQFYSAASTENVVLLGGVPPQLKIKCTCGTTLQDKYWLKGFFEPLPPIHNTVYEYYLRISERCPKCGSIIVIYRPKATMYIALVLFLPFMPSIKSLYPNQNVSIDINVEQGILIHWLTIVDDLLEKNPNKVCPLYHEDILKLWNLIGTNKTLAKKDKEKMFKVFPFDKIVKINKDLFRHKGRTILAFLSKGLMGILSEQLTRPNQQLNELLNVVITLYNEIGSWIYGNNDPSYIYAPLQMLLNHNKSIQIASFTNIRDFLQMVSEDLLKVLKDNNVKNPEIMNPKPFLGDDDTMEKLGYLWRSGEIYASALEVINIFKIPMDDDSINAVGELFELLGRWIYGVQDLIGISTQFETFKLIFQRKHDKKYDRFLHSAELFKNDFSEFITKFSE